jgi:hypothetical protein
VKSIQKNFLQTTFEDALIAIVWHLGYMISAFDHTNKVPIYTNSDELGWDFGDEKEAPGNDKGVIARAMTVFDGGVHHVGMEMVIVRNPLSLIMRTGVLGSV